MAPAKVKLLLEVHATPCLMADLDHRVSFQRAAYVLLWTGLQWQNNRRGVAADYVIRLNSSHLRGRLNGLELVTC